MAGDWIKMRIDLQSHPKIVRILSAMRPHDVGTVTDKFRVIGGLHAVWTVFDVHSEDGVLHGYTPEILDHIIGWCGFSAAMMSVGWLEAGPGEVLKMPEFQEHNGKSAKRRAEDQKRKRESRSSPQSVRNLSAHSADKKRTREEKRREDNKTYSSEPSAAEQEITSNDSFVAVLPTNKHVSEGEVYSVTLSQLTEFQTLYPAVNIEQSLKAMRGWLTSNPSKRKTQRGMPRFINAWLAREQDRGGTASIAPPTRKPAL